MTTKAEIVDQSMRAAPPAAVAALSVAGVALNDLVLLATLVYIVLQIGYLIHRWWRLGHNKDGGSGA